MADRFGAQYEGLRDFIRDLGVAPSRLDEAEQIFLGVAANSIVVQAKERANAVSRLANKAAMDVRKGTQPGIVTYGGEAYSMGAEFGALQYKQFKPWKGNKDDAGYFLWPSVRDFRDRDMMKQWVKEAWKVIRPIFPDLTGFR